MRLQRLSLFLAVLIWGCADTGEPVVGSAPVETKELALVVRADSPQTSEALLAILHSRPGASGRGDQFSIRRVTPDRTVDFKIMIVEPDPEIDYKILQALPKDREGRFEIRIMDSATGQVLGEETDAVQEFVDQISKANELKNFYEQLKPRTRGALNPKITP
jgi:hypothetical protein